MSESPDVEPTELGTPGGQPSEPVPQVAAEVFGDRLPLARRYAELLCSEGLVRGLIGPREPGRIWTRHILNSAALAPFVPADATVVDLGSGAGLPGIPLVLARPDLHVTLLEPLARRMRFLELACEQLRVPVTLLQARAQDGPRGADVVVARAVAPLDRLLGLALPLLRPGGILLAQKGGRAASELAAAADELERWAVAEAAVHALALGDGDASVICVLAGSQPLPLVRSVQPRIAASRGERAGRGMR